MEFEEIKRIWDKQKNEPLYTIDESALHRQVLRKNRDIRRFASQTEWGIFLIALLLAAFMILQGSNDNEIYKFPQAAIFLVVAGYIFWDRRRRLKNEGPSDRSLLGDLEQAIRTTDYSIKRQRAFVFWFLIPSAITVLINQIYAYQRKTWWALLLVVFAFGLAYWVTKKELRCKLLPKKRNLQTLRNLLVEKETEVDSNL